jgi:hypothetical protein
MQAAVALLTAADLTIFGPVPSRRLGQSLGIGNVPAKMCSYSCVYCQVGPTPATNRDPLRDIANDFVLLPGAHAEQPDVATRCRHDAQQQPECGGLPAADRERSLARSRRTCGWRLAFATTSETRTAMTRGPRRT